MSRAAVIAWIWLSAAISGCETIEQTRSLPSASIGDALSRGSDAAAEEVRPEAGAVTSPVPEDRIQDPRAEAAFYEPGSGIYVTPAPAGSAGPEPEGEITLNFENTNLLEVVKVVLSDLLGANYVVDPGVQGSVTLQTSQPLPRENLIPTLELLLRMNNAALVQRDGVYHVVPREKALRGMVSPQLGNSSAPLPRGFTVRIVPLRFVSAGEMQKILEPFITAGNVVRADSRRNLLILAGTGQEMTAMLETIFVFDVDWLSGMSVALFTPDFVDAKTLQAELEKIFGDTADTSDRLVKFAVIERLDALLVISPRKEYLAKVAGWVRRLDKDSGAAGQRLFVYHVQNGKAVELAAVLSQIFEKEQKESIPPAELAPGLEPAEIGSRPQVITQQTPPEAMGLRSPAAAQQSTVPQQSTAPAPETRRQSSGVEEGLNVGDRESIRVIADEVNNALLIMATAAQYTQVQEALKKLDIIPLQVLIEATIAEVTLTDNLSQGLEWFFKNELGSRVGQAQLDLGAAGLTALTPGFSYAITSAGAVRAVLSALASESKLKVISSPSLMVLNNQTATIQVGDQVPITTQQQQSTATTANIVNSVEFRDTGVLLTVTPRVNAGGLVTMEISQEVSDVVPNPTDPLTPTIQQRKINSTVAIQSGETVVLGGLIRESDSSSSSGIPGLHNLPLIGLLFGQDSDDRRRTELVVLITPRAVQGATQARDITNEFRDKMESLKPSAASADGQSPK